MFYDREIWVVKQLWVMVLTPLSTIFQLYRGGQFYLGRKPEYQEKTCRRSLTKSNYHTITPLVTN
jgi:hypothetical protein